MRRIVTFGPSLVVLVAAVVLLVAVPAAVRRIAGARESARVVLARQALAGDDILDRLQRATRAVADAVRPSVVHVEVASGPRRRGARSTGSGWVYDDRGHIVTNAHVLLGARSISVQFHDGRVLGAEVVGEPDPFTDIAVIRVAPFDGFIPAARASGEEPRQGDRVFVFGSPFGFKFSMSEGIVSGLGREPATANDFGGYTNFIQTDAAVNPGNSGGPLVDIRGRVIGMNVAIATGRDTQGTTEGQSAGISFAIPLFTIESVVDQILETGAVSRGYLGLSVGPFAADPDVGFDPVIGSGGVRVVEPTAGGPADQAGLRPGDIITRIGGRPVRSWAILRSIVSNHRPGEEVPITAWRDGSPREFTVTLGQFPRENLAAIGAANALRLFGLGLTSRRGPDSKPEVGVVVAGSAADEAGFEPGQRIVNVGGTPVATVDDVLLAASQQGLLLGRDVRITVAQRSADADASAEAGASVAAESLKTLTIRLRR